VIANLYSGERHYNKSNFYLNLSIYFNPKFQINQALLAENYLQMEEYKKSKKIYELFNKKNTIFYWHSVKKISLINSDLENETKALSFLINNFNNIKDPNLKIIYDVANLYRGFGKFKESIDYYTKVINILDNKHPSYADILYRRGASYERIKMWENSDKDLLESLKINPDDPHVLNYLAYSWLERNYKIDEAMDMLLLAHNKRPSDPYITDSVGWAYYLQGDYVKAKKFIRQAIKLLPSDPIINDHYADILWKLNKPLQANYFWKYVLNLEDIKPETKKKIKNKLIFGV
jgi:tetratricopeptide (TPR) repeat protein